VGASSLSPGPTRAARLEHLAAAVHRSIAQLAKLVELLPLQVDGAVGELLDGADDVLVQLEQSALLHWRRHLPERLPHQARKLGPHQQRQLRREPAVELGSVERGCVVARLAEQTRQLADARGDGLRLRSHQVGRCCWLAEVTLDLML